MSYCRFSSMNWTSSVYVYKDVSGWTTHVAAGKRMFPPIPDIGFGGLSMRLYRWSEETPASAWRGFVMAAWYRFISFWHNRVHMASLHIIPLRRIGLPHDGETFRDPTAIDCAARLASLRALGYRVPQHAIDELVAEQASGG